MTALRVIHNSQFIISMVFHVMVFLIPEGLHLRRRSFDCAQDDNVDEWDYS